jgi:long-chain fatty acid transport protein
MYLVWLIATLLGALSFEAAAANGMNSIGTGTAQLGVAGAGTAMALDASATMRNPAAGAWLGNVMTAELGVVVPEGGYRAGSVGENASIGLLNISPGYDRSISGVFPVPSYARNWRLSEQVAVGWSVSASGLNAFSKRGSATLARGIPVFEARCEGGFGGGQPQSPVTDLSSLCGHQAATVGVDLAQVLISGHWALRVTPDLSVGIAPVLAVQRIHIGGVGAFAAFSNFPDQTSDNGFDISYGGGARIGLLWKLGNRVSLGGAYQSRLYQTEFDKYRGSIIGGSLDVAPVINLGLQFRVMENHRLLLDYEQIRYSEIKPLANRVEPQPFTDNCFVPRLLVRSLPNSPSLDGCLGGPSGPGFGWHTVSVYKFGYQGQSGRLIWRAGYSWGGNPIEKDQVLPTVFAPAITDKHATVGFSWQLTPRLNLGFALIRSVKNRVRAQNTYSNATPVILGGALIRLDVGADDGDQFITNQLSAWQSQFSISLALPQ